MKYTESGKVGEAGGGSVPSDCGKVGRYSTPSYGQADGGKDEGGREVFSVPAVDPISMKVIEQNHTVLMRANVKDPHPGSFSSQKNGLA